MKVIAKKNRELALINAQNTQNENRAETITLVVPEEYEDYNKKIVFVTDDGTVWDVITNNEYKITNAITKYKQVDFYIWLTKEVDGESIDFRTKTKTLSFYHNEDASDEITDEEIHGVNTVVNLLEEEIEKVENLNIEATKIGSTTTVTITKKDGTTESVEINDGVDGKDGEDGKDAKINGKNSIEIEAGNNITIDNTETGIRINSTNDGGTTDYTDLENKPKINNVELSGNKSLNDLGIQPKGNYIEDNNYVHTDNNFNNTYKNKLEGLENYDDTEIKADISDIQDEQEEQNTEIENLQEENARLKATLPTTTGEGQDITLDKTAEMEFKKPPLPMGNSEQGILPEQYQQVEYIESTGTQYINTNYTPVENDDINIEKVKNTGTGCLFSAGNSTNQLILLASSSTNYYWKYFAAGNATAFFTEELSNFSTISIANGSISINNVVKASSTYAGTVDTTIQLFRRVNGESYATASIGRFTITNGNKTKLDLIPCYRISDNEVGMYDLVSNTFYTNAGTGTFNKGNNTPNPNYEQPITNVTGDVEVVVGNKNLFDKDSFNFNANWDGGNSNQLTLLSNGNIQTTANYSNWRAKAIDIKALKPNTQYTLSIELISVTSTQTNKAVIRIPYNNGKSGGYVNFDSNESLYQFNSLSKQTFTFTTPSDMVNIGLSLNSNGSDTTAVFGNIMIEKGSTSTPYTPHKEQILPLTLGNIELCKIGDYQDYIYKENDKWYKCGMIGKIVYDGVNNRVTYKHNSITSDTKGFYQATLTNKISGNSGATTYGLSNYLRFVSGGASTAFNNNSSGIWWEGGNSTYVYLILEQTSLQDVNNWLSENNLIIYYVLANPVITEITDTTLINELEDILNATSYEEQTNISSNQNALFSVEAYQDAKVILAEKGTYSKPSTGIPKADLASDVQTSLGKADTALQSHQDISGKANKISVVQTSASTIEINPNTFYKFGEVASLNITLASITDNTIYNEYMFEFVSGTTATTLTLPSSIKWLETPTIDANKIYQCSIVDNIGLLVGVANV